jgi:HEAT repeat protein
VTGFVAVFDRAAYALLWVAAAVAAAMLLAVVVQRIVLAGHAAWAGRVTRKYAAVLARALAGDAVALRALEQSPSRHRITIAMMMVQPLVEDREPAKVAAARAAFEALQLVPVALRLLRSRFWWRRSLGIRAIGGFQVRGHTNALVAALDDPHPYVRGAALDALADMQDPATLPAIVVRLHDGSLDRGRRVAALQAFGTRSEEFLLELAQVDPEHRVNYARALALCGSARARPVLGEWVADPRAEVRSAALHALARVGLDETTAARALAALDSDEADVRAAAAGALIGFSGAGDAAGRLARHLDDTWPVAVRAARALAAMGESGRSQLQARASQPDLAGVLARQMLWKPEAPA